MNRYLISMIASGVWINVSEFVRNELWLKQQWIEKYHSLGLVFPSDPINGMLWVLWGFVFTACLSWLSRRLNDKETILIGWIMGFGLMWLVTGNLNVLPFDILSIAIPWSMIEVIIAVYIARRLASELKQV